MQYVQFTAARADTGQVLPYGTATVYLTGSATLASLFNAVGGAIGNPATADATGLVSFQAANGKYDVVVTSSDASYSTPKMVGFQIYDLSTLVGSVTSVTLTQPAAGFTLTNSGVGQTTAATATFALANDMAALEGLASTGFAARIATDSWAQRSIVQGTGILVTNGTGVAGNPSIAADIDNDAALAANSAAKIPSQQAVKAYVDALVQGLSWKKAVRAATTITGVLATVYANAMVIDGVTLATGDRILVKNQVTGSENGIYTVNATGAPTRALDADIGAELVNATVYISEGTTLADSQWTCSTNAPITPGTTALVFSQLSGSGTGTTTNAITYSNSGTGVAPGGTFNGSAAVTVSYNSIGAQGLNSNLTAYAGANWSAGVQVPTLTAANTIVLKTVGAAAGNLLDRASGDSLYRQLIPNIQSVVSSATVTPTFANDMVIITAQAVALALANPTGTAVDGWGEVIRIKDDGLGARAISYGTQYRAVGVTLPTTTVLGKTLYLGMTFNNAATKWDVTAVAQE